jgi:choline dehydrogenase
MIEQSYDFIVVGGGSAGCAAAATLAERTDASVLLIEAGADLADPAMMPAALRDISAPVTAGHNWDFRAIVREPSMALDRARAGKIFAAAARHLGARPPPDRPESATEGGAVRFPYPLGKVMGGGSTINGANALHAHPSDYEAWAALGHDWWSWEQVRPLIERGFGPGRRVPVGIPQSACTELQQRFLQACHAEGFPAIDCASDAIGAGLVPKNLVDGLRASSALAWLRPQRGRPNLHVLAGAEVERVLFTSGPGPLRATGVEVDAGGMRRTFAAGHVVLCAGAIQSPAILMRSGVGAAGDLARLGIECRLPLNGVGRRLVEHPVVVLWGVARSGFDNPGEPIHQAMLQCASAGASRWDLQLFMMSSVPADAFPPLRQILDADMALGIAVMLALPRSQGSVSLASLDPKVPPRIVLNCAQDPEDVRRLMDGVRLADRLLRASPLAGAVERIAGWEDHTLSSDSALAEAVQATVRGSWHPVGTLGMGPAGHPMAVVNQRGRLHGCANLSVADASIMPAIPSVPVNLTCMLIGERVASALADDVLVSPALEK